MPNSVTTETSRLVHIPKSTTAKFDALLQKTEKDLLNRPGMSESDRQKHQAWLIETGQAPNPLHQPGFGSVVRRHIAALLTQAAQVISPDSGRNENLRQPSSKSSIGTYKRSF